MTLKNNTLKIENEFFMNKIPNKSLLREVFRKKRKKLSLYEVLEKSKKITDKVINILVKFKKNLKKLNVMLYSDFDNEVKTAQIFDFCVKEFGGAIFPKIIDSQIQLFFADNLNDFEIGTFGILEPNEKLCKKFEYFKFRDEKFKKNEMEIFKDKNISKKDKFLNINEINIIIVPGLIFDSFGNRIGFGRGYYDRFLQRITAFYSNKNKNYMKKMLLIGVCYDFQVFKGEKLEFSNHDYQLDVIITESNIYFGEDYKRRKHASDII
ncbi:MAG: hypothetical protein LBF97_06975 [Elusimicrobiota bacterium]|jgi:5-formyltetrahydrofolate cyclo-ligase|nr:hypothetical protein [Elusimicrobiota bacterium]